MSDPAEKIVHVYDDIQEADNVLPRWWLGILWGTVAFAMLYWVGFEVLHVGDTPLERYRADKLARAEAEAERLKAGGELTPEKLLAMSQNAAIVGEGQGTFKTICASCHGPTGGGTVGPNLTDKFWLHGGKPEQIIVSIRGGYQDKGMPAWGPQLGEDKVRSVAAYVLSIHNTNVPGGKAPQGDAEP